MLTVFSEPVVLLKFGLMKDYWQTCKVLPPQDFIKGFGKDQR